MKKHQSILTRVLPLLMVLLTATVLQAAPVSRTTARQAAYSFLQGKGVNLAGPNALTDVSARTNLSNIYIFDCAGVGGYAVVAADNRVKPILSYSQQDNFPQTVPADLQNRLARYDRIVADAVRNNVTPSPEVTNQWQELLSNGNDGSKDENIDVILYTNMWGDCFPYNTRCPFDLDGEQYHCKVGSLAVAVGELIYYYISSKGFTNFRNIYLGSTCTTSYEYPFYHGSKTYTDPTYGTLSADFSNRVIDAELVARDPISYQLSLQNTNTQFHPELAADFLFNVAVGIHTKFGPYESKANLDSALKCLEHHFGYVPRSSSSGDGTTASFGYEVISVSPSWAPAVFDSLLYPEISNGHPVLCEAVNQSGVQDTHYFLIEGVSIHNNIYYFYMNWGDQGDSINLNAIGGRYAVFSQGGRFQAPTVSSPTYKLTRIVTGLIPKENWTHTDKDLIELPWTGTNFQAERDYAHSINVYYSYWDEWTNNGNGFAAIGLFGRTSSSTSLRQLGMMPEGSNYGQNVREVFMQIFADSISSTTTTSRCCFQSDYVSDTAWFTIRQQPRYPSDTIIHDNGEFDHVINYQPSSPYSRYLWALRLPRSEFEGLGSLKEVLLYTPAEGRYWLYIDTFPNETQRPDVDNDNFEFTFTPPLEVTSTTANGWNVYRARNDLGSSSPNLLDNIDSTYPDANYIWITFEVAYPSTSSESGWAAVSNRPGTGDYWFWNGTSWQHMTSDYAWMIRPVFTNSRCERPTNFNVWGSAEEGVYPEWVGPRDAIFEIEMGPRGFSHGDSTAYVFRYPHDSTDIAPNISDNDDPNSPTRQYWCDMLDSNGNILILQPNTSYDFYIRTVCDAANGIYSPWVGLAEPLETDCRPYPIPFYEDFTGGFPQCWEEISMSGILEWLMNSGYWTSNMRLPSGLFPINPQPQPSDGNILPTAGAPADSAMLITPPIDISTADRPVLTFCQRQTSYVATDTNVINIYYRTAEDAAWVLLYRDSIYSYDIDTVILNLPRPNPVECTQYQLGFEIMTDGVLGAVFGSVAVLDSTPRNVITSAYPADAGTTSGDGRYMLADQATVSATANPGYCFDHWEIHSIYGTITSYQNPLRISVFSHLTCVAIFEPGFSIDIEQVNTRSIAVYPNPTTGRLTLDADDVRSVEVIDMMGRIVYTARETNQLDLGPLPRGAYLLRITLPDDVCVTKINKQ